MFKRLRRRIRDKHNQNDLGIGLGLCICKAILQEFNGAIDFVSEPAIGTTFFFTFEAAEIPSDNSYMDDDESQSQIQQSNFKQSHLSYLEERIVPKNYPKRINTIDNIQGK